MTRLVRSFARVTATLVLLATVAVAQTASIHDQSFGGSVNQPFSAQIVAANATQYSVSSGTMPAGLVLDASTGAVTGTPTVVDTTSVQIQVTGADGGIARAYVTFAICDPSQGPPSFDVSDHENDYEFAANIPDHGTVGFSIRNHPSSITVTGVPPGVTFTPSLSGTSALAEFDWEADTFTGGNFAVTITATNAAGTTSKTFHWIIHPGLKDWIESDKSSYNAGDTITLTAPFSAPVLVSGTPYIPLWGTKRANYVGGSGTANLQFQYVVTADDPQQHTIVDHVELNGASVATADGVPVHDLWAGQTIAGGPGGFTINTGAPPIINDQTFSGKQGVYMNVTISAAGATTYQIASGTLPAGLALNVGTGVVTGTPTVSGNIVVGIKVTGDGGTATANVTFALAPTDSAPVIPALTDREDSFAASGSSPTSSLTIPISNQPTSVTIDGAPTGVIATGEPSPASYPSASFTWDDINLTGGEWTVTITASNSAGTTHGSFRWIVHPGIRDPIKTDKSSYTAGDTITFTVLFSSPVVVSGTPYIQLWGTKRANYVSGSGTQQLTFQYQVTADDPATTGYSVDTVTLGDGHITTAGGTTATLFAHAYPGSLPPSFNIVQGGNPPLSAPVFPAIGDRESAYHLPGNVEQSSFFTVAASNNPTAYSVTGVPPGVEFHNEVSGPWFQWYDSHLSGGEYTVTVTATNSVGTGSVTFHWVIHPGITAQIVTDKTSYAVGDIITFTVKFSANVVVTGKPFLALWAGKHADYVSGSGTSQLTFQYQVTADDAPRTGVYVNSVSVGSGQISTPGGTAALLDAPLQIGQTQWTFAIVAPPPGNNPPPTTKSDQTITFSSPTGAVVVGQSITLGATSSAGLPITYSVVSGDATVSGNTLTPNSTATLIVRASSAGNDATNAASVDVNFGNPQPAVVPPTKSTQQIAFSVSKTDVPAEQPLTLNATASSGLPITYTVVSGPATVSGNTITFTGTGNVTLRAVQDGNASYTSADATITVTAHPVTRLVNISSRVYVSGSDDGATAGFVVTGTTAKKILIRAVGDSLASFGVTDGLANPTLTLYGANGAVITSNSGWANDAQIAATASDVGAFPLAAGKTDAALLVTLQPGLYSARVTGKSAGSVLLEVYDAGATAAVPTKQLINISTRAHVDANHQIYQGFVISGDQPKQVLIRAVGATLKTFGVNDGVADPSIKLYAGTAVVASDDDWGTAGTASNGVTLAPPTDIPAASTATGAFALPNGSKDAALLVTLQPGLYSVVVTGGTDSGTVLVEAYEVP